MSTAAKWGTDTIEIVFKFIELEVQVRFSFHLATCYFTGFPTENHQIKTKNY